MADDIEELLDEVESKFIDSENRISNESQVLSENPKRKSGAKGVVQELDAAIHSICSIPEPVGASPISPNAVQISKGNKRKCTVLYVGGPTAEPGLSSGVSQRRNSQRRPKHNSTKICTKRYFAKPVFELSVKDLEAESARRKQKELIETLFEKKLAVVTDKMILDVRKFKRIKSDVWTNFGDVRLLICEAEVKKLNIDHHVIHIGEEEMLLCKSFVACVKCTAVFSYESHGYGTSTLRSHLKSCGKPRYNMKEKKRQMLRLKRSLCEIIPNGSNENNVPEPQIMKPVFQEKMIKFRDQARKLQEQTLLFFLSKLKSFNILENREFKNMLQAFVQIGATLGDVDASNFLCSQTDLAEVLLNQAYTNGEEAFRAEMINQYGLSFSVEIWTDSVEKISYVSLFCHYANHDGVFRSVVLLTTEFPYEQKSSEDVTKLFFESLSFSNLGLFKRMLVLDYSYNMVTAFENEQFIQCIAYSLNSAVQTVINALSMTENEDDPFALPGFASLINQCRSLVLHFKENKLQTNLPKYLTMCPTTSWKSILEMLESINNQWDHIADILNERGEMELFSFDQELLSLVVDFLELFRDGSTELTSLSNPTLNIVIPWLTKWKAHCLHKEDESAFLATLKSYMSSSIDEEVAKRITVIHKLATMLDPRFKELQFLTSEDQAEAREQAESMVKECKETLQYNKIVEDSSEAIIASTDRFAELYSTTLSSNEENNAVSGNEVEDYLTEYFVMGKQDLDTENKFNPLKYWLRNKMRYPHLSRVALWILSCPASAVRSDESTLASDWMVIARETELLQKYMHRGIFVKSFRSL